MKLKCFRCGKWDGKRCNCEDGQTIFNGDSRKIMPLLPAAEMVFTSPPYWNQRQYELDEFDWDDVVPKVLISSSDNSQILVNLGIVHKDGFVIRYWDSLINEMEANGFRLFGWYVWEQGSGMPGDWNGRLAPSHEFIFHFNKEARHPNKWHLNKFAGHKHSKHGMRRKDGEVMPWSNPGALTQPYKIPKSIISVMRVNGRQKGIDHPARFPVELPESIIKTWTDPGELVIDPFLGSGPTLRACKDLGRRGIGMDISENYCEQAANRLRAPTKPRLHIDIQKKLVASKKLEGFGFQKKKTAKKK